MKKQRPIPPEVRKLLDVVRDRPAAYAYAIRLAAWAFLGYTDRPVAKDHVVQGMNGMDRNLIEFTVGVQSLVARA